MTVTDVHKDPGALSLTITSEFPAPTERVWQLWADPRQLERWWGPPGYPATFVQHEFTAGGRSLYFMTGPEGDRHYGWWRVISVDEPGRIEMEDGFAEADGTPSDTMPSGTFTVTIDDIGDGRTRMAIRSTFPSLEAMEQLIAMGQVEGMSEALGQIDDILAEEHAA